MSLMSFSWNFKEISFQENRKTSEKLIKKLTIFAPYRCKKCGWRGLQSKIVLTNKALKNGITYLVMIAFAAFIIYEILKKFI